MPNHVSLAFAEYKDFALGSFGLGIHKGVSDNALLFPELPVSAAKLLTDLTDFQTKLSISLKGSVGQTDDKNLARELLISDLRQIAAYVESVAKGNADTIRAAGFLVVTHSHNPSTQLDRPTILSITAFITTKLKIHGSSVRNAHGFELQYRIGTGEWQPLTPYPNPRAMVMDNTIPGTLYEFRLRAIGGSTGFSDWSDSVKHMAT